MNEKKKKKSLETPAIIIFIYYSKHFSLWLEQSLICWRGGEEIIYYVSVVDVYNFKLKSYLNMISLSVNYSKRRFFIL